MSRAATWPGASTRLVALLGWPIAHSLSPAIHNAAFDELGLDLVYVALPTPPEHVAATVEVLGRTGAVGANVTVPHKQAVLPLCRDVSEEARLVGAVNTLTWRDGTPVGHNTDAVGLQHALTRQVAPSPGQTLTVLGTGGAARAVAVAAARIGLTLQVVGRRRDPAEQIAGVARAAGGTAAVVDLADEAAVRGAVGAAAIVVNATPLGLHDEDLPPAFMSLGGGQTAYDLIYNPAVTPFLAAATACGAAAHNGLEMLLEQAVAAFETWTGQSAPRETMRGALLGTLR